MSNLFRILSVAIFLVGITVFSQAYVTQESPASEIEPAKSFEVVYVETRLTPEGDLRVTGGRTRFVKANGEWKQIWHKNKDNRLSSSEIRNENGTAEAHIYAGLSDGIYAKLSNSNERITVSPPANQRMLENFRSHSFLKNNPNVVRKDQIAGVEAYTIRKEVEDVSHPIAWMEQSYSPKTGFTPLRTVTHFRDGSEVRIEAIRVQFREIPENLNDDMKSLPVNTEPRKSGK